MLPSSGYKTIRETVKKFVKITRARDSARVGKKVNSRETEVLIKTTRGHSSLPKNKTHFLLLAVFLVDIGETGRRMADRFREHRREVINGKNDLHVPAHFNQPNHTLEDMKVAVLKAGLVKQEMRFIFRQGTVARSGLDQDFNFT